MALFRRRKAAETTEQDLHEDDRSQEASEGVQDPGAQDASADAAVPFDRADGPWDVSEADTRERLDLGSLLIAPVEGMQLRLEVDQERSVITAVTAVIADSALQITAFAAPRSGGLWAEIREELARAVVAAGGTAEVVDGPLGPELRARRPAAGPGGRTVFAPSRFVGVDGPRWFLRAVLTGRAAVDEQAAAPLVEVLRSTVVVRGSEPMGPREMLPIVVAEDAQPGPQADDDASDRSGQRDPLTPFERGPEITQVG